MTTQVVPVGQLPVTDAQPGPQRVLAVHPTAFTYSGSADLGAPGGIAAVYRDLVADDYRLAQVVADVRDAVSRGRHCLVLTQWKTHVTRFADALADLDPLVLIGGMGAKTRNAATARLADPSVAAQLVVATWSVCG